MNRKRKVVDAESYSKIFKIIGVAPEDIEAMVPGENPITEVSEQLQ